MEQAWVSGSGSTYGGRWRKGGCVSVQVHKEGLQAELKMVREDIHRVTLELTQHQQRVDKLHAKHDVLVSRNATPDGEVHSQVP